MGQKVSLTKLTTKFQQILAGISTRDVSYAYVDLCDIFLSCNSLERLLTDVLVYSAVVVGLA